MKRLFLVLISALIGAVAMGQVSTINQNVYGSSVKTAINSTITQSNSNKTAVDSVRAGTLGGVGDHTLLSNIGTLSHDAIETSLDAKLNIADTTDLATVAKILTDTSTYYSIKWGAGNAGDTVGFNLDSIFWDTRWGGSHTLNITAIYTKVSGVSPDIDVVVLTNTTPVASGATVVTTTDITTTAKDVWTATTTINNPTIEPGESLMVRIDQLTQKPYSFSLIIDGYLTE